MKSQTISKKFQQCLNSPGTDHHQADTSEAFTVSWVWETSAEQVPFPVPPSPDSKNTSLPRLGALLSGCCQYLRSLLGSCWDMPASMPSQRLQASFWVMPVFFYPNFSCRQWEIVSAPISKSLLEWKENSHVRPTSHSSVPASPGTQHHPLSFSPTFNALFGLGLVVIT